MKFQNLISKGILGFSKALTLITKGIIDRKIPVVPPLDDVAGGKTKRPEYEPWTRKFSYRYKIIGKRKYSIIKDLDIIGINKFKFNFKYAIISKLKILVVNSINIVGNYLYKVLQSFGVVGNSKHLYSSNVQLKGCKQSKLLFSSRVIGSSKVITELHSLFVGELKTGINLSKTILGNKLFKNTQEIKIMGTKDISNIIAACLHSIEE